MSDTVPEQVLNGLLRRVDWRFLVRRADAPGTVAYDGHLDVAPALRSFASDVVELGSTAPGGAELVLGNGRSDLGALRRAVGPGGTCVVEWRAPAGRGGGRILRRVSRAGFTDADVYWAWPPPARGLPRFWLPLGSHAAATYLLASRPALEAPLELAQRTVRDAAWTVAARAGLLAPLCVLGRTESPEGIGSAGLPALIAHLEEERAPAVRWLLVTQGARSINKVLALPFAEPDPRPLAVVKIARVAASDPMLDRESEILREVQSLALTVSGTPHVLAATRVSGRVAVAETFLGGSALWTRLRPDTFPELAAAAAEWSSGLVVPGPRRPRSEWWGALVAGPLESFRARYGTVADPADLRATEQRLARLPDLPRAVEHRDFSPWNVALAPSGEFVVHDWESAEPDGLPVTDLVYFLAYAAFFLSGALESDGIEEAYAAAFGARTEVGRVAASALELYLARTGIDGTVVSQLRLLTWIVHAAAEYERLQGDTGTAPAAEALRKAVFFRLWQAELGLSSTQ